MTLKVLNICHPQRVERLLGCPAGFVIVTTVIVSWFITYLRDVNNLQYRGEIIHLLSTMDIRQLTERDNNQVSHEKNPALLFIESWLFNRDPYFMVSEINPHLTV